MNNSQITKIAKLFKAKNITMEPGLTEDSIVQIENLIGRKLPEDLHDLLISFVPTGTYDDASFPNWHQDPSQIIREAKESIAEAFKFDIEKNDFWPESFGQKPDSKEAAIEKALELIKDVPPLVPIYGHRFLTSEPGTVGNPVLSLLQPSDAIVYGANLVEYFEVEFNNKQSSSYDMSRNLPFWGDIIT